MKGRKLYMRMQISLAADGKIWEFENFFSDSNLVRTRKYFIAEFGELNRILLRNVDYFCAQ